MNDWICLQVAICILLMCVQSHWDKSSKNRTPYICAHSPHLPDFHELVLQILTTFLAKVNSNWPIIIIVSEMAISSWKPNKSSAKNYLHLAFCRSRCMRKAAPNHCRRHIFSMGVSFSAYFTFLIYEHTRNYSSFFRKRKNSCKYPSIDDLLNNHYVGHAKQSANEQISARKNNRKTSIVAHRHTQCESQLEVYTEAVSRSHIK